MKKLVCIAVLSAMIVLVFAVIASAQDTQEQSTSSDPNSADQGQTPTEQAAPAEASSPTVSIRAEGFDPPQLDVAPGATVTFVNEDTVPHTVSLEGLFDSSEISPGYTFPVTLNGSGTVTYHDEENPEMQGTITVGGASQGEEAATPPEEESAAEEPQQTTDGSTQPSQDSAQGA